MIIYPVRKFHTTEHMNWSYYWLEVLEFLYEIKNFNIKGMISELCDVYTCFVVIVWTQYRIDLGIIWKTSALEWERRIIVWKNIFKQNGLEFKVKYLKGGGNYKRVLKVDNALSLAEIDQGKKRIANDY